MQLKQEQEKQLEPYIGPRYFGRTVEDQARFFGRNQETEEIITLISSHQILLVYAQSGAGKTSILNAQVTPELEKNGFEVLPVASVNIPPSHIRQVNISIDSANSLHKPNLYMFNALCSLKPDVDLKLLLNKSLPAFLNDYFPTKSDEDGNPSPQVIIFDQFEELFNLFYERAREDQEIFFKQITEAIKKNSFLRVVLVVREDYLARLDPFARFLPDKLRFRYRLEPLRRDAALLAVTQPIKGTGVYFGQGVAEELIDNLTKIHVEDVFHKPIITKGDYVEPVHLQVVCQRLWNKVIISQRLTHITHDHLEDVDAALKDFYDEAVYDTAKQTKIKEEVIRDWCENKLITTTGTRSIIHQEYSLAGGLSNKAVSILENKYLVRAESRFGATWIELTHDRLIEPIKESNKKWRKQQIKSKRLSRLKIIVPIAVIAVVGISIFAYNTYEQSVLQQNKLVNALVDASASLINSGNYTGAIKNLDKALSIDPNNVNALTNKGRALNHLGNQNEAIQYIDKALAIDPNYVPALEYKGSMLVDFGNYTQGRQYINKAYILGAKNKSINSSSDETELYIRGYALDNLGNYTGAIKYFDKMLLKNSNNVRALIAKGQALEQLGNYTGAIKYFDKAIARGSKNLLALNDKGNALYYLGNYTQAIQYFDKALSINPKYVNALNNKGAALDSLGNDTQAIQYFDKALAIDPKDTEALDNKGNALNNLGKYNEAIKYFDKALAIDPKDTYAKSKKDDIIIDNMGNLTGAIKY
jgi:tetratricopeptide (TPR) repeat protein